MSPQSRQANVTQRSGQRSETRSQGQVQRTERSQGRSQTSQKRQDARTDRSEERSDVRSNRQQQSTDRQEQNQDYRGDAREDWQDYGEDWHHDNDDHRDGYWGAVAVGTAAAVTAYAIGTTITASAFTALPCTSTVVPVGGVSCYRCGTTRYQPAYAGNGVAYVVVNPPAGY